MKLNCTIINISAVAAISWIAALSFHIGIGHGVPCKILGGSVISWSAFSLNCAKNSMFLAEWRLICAGGIISNFALAIISWVWWCREYSNTRRFTAWATFIINALMSFTYLITSTTFNVGDWSAAGALIGQPGFLNIKILLLIFGFLGYILTIKFGASMLSQMLGGVEAGRKGWKIVITMLATAGVISIVTTTISPSNSVQMSLNLFSLTLISNIGLMFIPKLLSNSNDRQAPLLHDNRNLLDYAIVTVTAFVLVLGPGVVF